MTTTAEAQKNGNEEGYYSDWPLGEVYTTEAQGQLRVGLGEADITPNWPVRLLYGADDETDEFYDRTRAKVMVLEVDGERFAVVLYDIIGVRSKDVSGYIKEYVADRTSLQERHIIMAGTHNHSYTSPADSEVRHFIAERTVQAVSEAEENMFSARIGIKKTNAREDLNHNRAELNGEANSRLYVIKIEDSRGNLRGIHYNYGSHPTIFTEWGDTQGQIGPEWPGYVNEYIRMRKRLDLLYDRYENKNGIDVEPWIMFSEGSAGDQEPRRSDIYILSDREPSSKVFMEKLAWEVLGLAESTETDPEVNIKMFSKKIEIDKRDGGRYSTVLQSLVINNSVLSTIPGELNIGLAKRFIRNSPYDNNIFITMAEDGIGYIVPEHLALERVTYQSKGVDFEPYYGEKIVDESMKLINSGYQPKPRSNPDELLGSISGEVEYDGENSIAVGVKRIPSGPNYSGGFWGRRTVVDRDGTWRIDSLAPGQFYVYVVEADPDRPAPTELKSDYDDIRDLVVGFPVKVHSQQETRNVNFAIPEDILETGVESLEVDESSLEVDGYKLSGQMNVKGKLSTEEEIVVGVYPAELQYRSLTSYLRNPVLHTSASQDGEFEFQSLPPGQYRIASYIDINENDIPENVDIVTHPEESPIISIQEPGVNNFIDDPSFGTSRIIRDKR